MRKEDYSNALHSAAATLLIAAEQDQQDGLKLRRIAADLQKMAFERGQDHNAIGNAAGL